jgi:hypothetical protein
MGFLQLDYGQACDRCGRFGAHGIDDNSYPNIKVVCPQCAGDMLDEKQQKVDIAKDFLLKKVKASSAEYVNNAPNPLTFRIVFPDDPRNYLAEVLLFPSGTKSANVYLEESR